ILNQELEPQGFRLLINGQHLVLIDIPSQRVEYPRPTVTEDGEVYVGSVSDAESQQAEEETAPSKPTAKRPISPARSRTNASAGQPKRRVRQASATGEDEAAPELQSTEDDQTELIVKTVKNDALTIARRIRNTFKSRSELIDEGPRGLPGFRVFYESAEK